MQIDVCFEEAGFGGACPLFSTWKRCGETGVTSISFLLLYIGEGRKFDDQEIGTNLRALNGATRWPPDDDCIARYEYQFGDDRTTICVKKDRETIVIDGTGSASLGAALHIQSTYHEELHMIDEAYSFDVILRGIYSLEELEQRIMDAGQHS